MFLIEEDYYEKKVVEVSTDYKIMIVDDEEGIINSMRVMLTRSGYFCVGVSNPLEAIEIVKRKFRYDHT